MRRVVFALFLLVAVSAKLTYKGELCNVCKVTMHELSHDIENEVKLVKLELGHRLHGDGQRKGKEVRFHLFKFF